MEPIGKLADWLRGNLPAGTHSRLVKFGLIDGRWAAAGKLLRDHVNDFEKWLRGTKTRTGYLRNTEYVRITMARIRHIFEACRCERWSDISKDKVETQLSKLDVESKTYNHYLTAIRHFCNWMVDNERAVTSPLAKIGRLNIVETEHRRALSVEEVCNLLAATEKAPNRFGMTGHERAVLYLVAIESGLRVRELQSLRVCSFDLDNNKLTLEPEFCKNRQPADQLLKTRRAGQLRAFFTGKEPNDRAFNMPSNFHTAEMLYADLDDTDIDRAGVVFHSLRHTLATELDKSRASQKECKTIMRHSDRSDLTLGVYTHVRPYDIRQAIERLPDYPWPGEKEQQKEKVA
jgi:integrase